MKQSYIFSNDEVIVSDFNNGNVELKKYEYQDNIEDILALENVLEGLNADKKAILSEIDDLEKLADPKTTSKTNKFIIFFWLTIVTISIILLGVSGMDAFKFILLALTGVTIAAGAALFTSICNNKKKSR